MRWKAIFYLSRNESENASENPETYGLPSKKCPTQVKELIPFENDLLQMVKTVEFRRTGNDFQTRLKNDMRNMRASEKNTNPSR